ncbi:MAG: alpha/beta hydrolase [Anaerolineae bacterium]|nr:alpha/beta hydrolase [Anaerolineae bacterium]
MNIKGLAISLILAAVTLLGCTIPGLAQPTIAPSPQPGQPSLDEVRISLTADRTSLQPGECAILQWSVEGGEVVQLDGEWVSPSSERQVCPQATTSYSLAVYVGVGPPNPPRAHEEVEIVVAAGAEASPAASVPSPGMTPVPTVMGSVRVVRDLQFGSYELDGQEHGLLLDLYLPQGSPQPWPLLVYIHGGGWMEGSKDTCPGTTFAQRGYVMACVDYRLGSMQGCPEALIFPAQIRDVKAAVRWLRSHASEYGFDSDRFGAIGNSSGGHLAALLGTSYGVADLDAAENAAVSDAVQAVCDWFGPVDITQGPVVFAEDPCQTHMDYLNATYGGEATPYFYWTLAWGTFLGGSLTDPAVLQQADRATPLSYVDHEDPPFLVIHGEADGMVPIEQSELLVQALMDAGVEVTFVRLPGMGHSFAGPTQEVDPAFLEPTLEFLNTHLMASESP